MGGPEELHTFLGASRLAGSLKGGRMVVFWGVALIDTALCKNDFWGFDLLSSSQVSESAILKGRILRSSLQGQNLKGSVLGLLLCIAGIDDVTVLVGAGDAPLRRFRQKLGSDGRWAVH